MVWIVLLLILAALFFALSVYLEAIGVILGFITAASALAVASFKFQLEPGTIMILGIFGFSVMLGAIVVITAIRQS